MNDSCEPRNCPRCGETIAEGALDGLCPKCLLEQASIPTENGTDTGLSGAAPPLEDLAKAFPQLEILALVGQGGMGFIFKARQAKLDRLVALKILRQPLAREAAFAERFEREGRLLARLSHPNIVAVYDFGQANGFFYLLMEFVDGVNLRQALKAGRFTPDQALAIVPKICEALQFAHTEGILHRDIKPENILLDSKGRVKIADFGIARLLEEPPSTSTLTGTVGVLGTPQYMAPEQLEKAAHIDHRADIYSLGVVFYEMLTGELPIGRFAAPSENCAVDQRIDKVVFRTLEKKPERRPQSAGELKTEVESITQTPARESSTALSAQKLEDEGTGTGAGTCAESNRAPRRWSGAVVSTVVILALLIIAGGVWHSFRSARANAADKPTVHAPANEQFTREISLVRATNQAVASVQDTWTAGVWCDSLLEPGETLSARVSLDGEPLNETGCSSLLFTQFQPGTVSTSTALSWFFGGPKRQGFGKSEAEQAGEQLRKIATGQAITIKANQSLELFSVTNSSGRALRGYAELNRLLPKPLSPGSPQPQAVVHIHRSLGHVPNLVYSVELPEGYALRASANMGHAATHYPVGEKGADYYTSWFLPPFFPAATSPGDLKNLPAQMDAQRTTLESQFRELKARGPITITLGEPYPVFSLTNNAGAVYRAFFELHGPEEAAAKRQSMSAQPQAATHNADALGVAPPRYVTPAHQGLATNAPKPIGPPRLDTPISRPVRAVRPAASSIDPATGLPVSPGTTAAPRIDPATGLPAGYAPPFGTVPGPATHDTPKTSHK